MRAIGVTGTHGSGKDTAAQILAELLDAPNYNLADELREELRRRGLEVNRDNLTAVVTAWRKKEGGDVLAKRIYSRIIGLQKKPSFVVMGPMRHPAEVSFFKKKFGKKFVLLAVDAPAEIRFQRMKERMREGEAKMTFAQFKEKEAREMSGKGADMNISACMAQADYTVSNEGTMAELKKKLAGFVKKVS
jgi:dephospho-CoA kinase